MKSMIIYYSRSGNTEKLAQQLQKDLDAKLLKIIPEEAYGNYIASCLRVSKERKQKVIPAFVTKIPDLNEYDIIFLGYPVWAQDMPAFVAEFMQQCDLQGKKVIPFVTYGMTGINWTRKTLNKVCFGAEILFPYQSGVFKKGDYNCWIEQVRKYMNKEAGESK